MTTVTVDVSVVTGNENPKVAHLSFNHNPYRALCGRKLRGVEVGDDYDTCVVCLDLAETYARGGQ